MLVKLNSKECIDVNECSHKDSQICHTLFHLGNTKQYLEKI